jgi:putative ABC transport system permease protein
MFLLKLIERNLRRSPRRTALTAATIALSTFIYVLLLSVPGSIDRIVKQEATTLRLIVINRNLPFYGLPARYCDEVKQMEGAAACVAVVGWPATYRDVSDPIFAIAEGLEIVDVFPDYDLSGDARRALEREKRGAVAGWALMHKYNWKPGQQIILRGSGRDHLELPFVLLGEMHSKRYPNVFAFRRDYLGDELKKHGDPNPDLVWNLVVRVDSAQHVDSLIRQIDETFRNSDYETRTLSESDALAAGLAAVGDIRGIIFSLCAVVIVTVLLIAANSTAMMVRERMNEVAVMRALGFGRGEIAAMMLGECAAVGLAGGVLGAGFALWLFGKGFALTALIGGFGVIWVTPASAAVALAVAAAIGMLSGVVPIWNALKPPPAAALTTTV